mgnify:CR=1 FL=1
MKIAEGSDKDAMTSAETLVREYTEGFNKMDKRKYFIETVEREEIYTALDEMLDLLPDELKVNKERLLNLFDELKNF